MMNSSIPQQSTFLYKGKWSQKLDQLKLSTVIHMKGDRDGAEKEVPEACIIEAMEAINKAGDPQLSLDDVKVRLKVLKERYNTFKEVVATRGVHWNVNENIVIADELVWSQIFKRNPFARAYYHRDEPEFYLLATVFGMIDVKQENVTEVIVISDTTGMIGCQPIGRPSFSPADPDEVNSPVLGEGSKVCCKLFIEDSDTFERHSSTDAPVFNLAPTSAGSLKYKMENRPPTYSIPFKETEPKYSPGVSSSSSWSPFPSTRKTAS